MNEYIVGGFAKSAVKQLDSLFEQKPSKLLANYRYVLIDAPLNAYDSLQLLFSA